MNTLLLIDSTTPQTIDAFLNQQEIKILLNEELTELYEEKNNHKYYPQTVEHAEDMGVHMEGKKPEKLLKINRPNETEEILKYRLNIWQNVTEGLGEKVINTLNRIYNPRFFKVEFKKTPPLIKDNSLEIYLTKGIPHYNSLMGFITETFTKKNLSDPNGVIMTIPLNRAEALEDENTFLAPEYIFFESKSVIKFSDQKFYIFKEEDKLILALKRWVVKFIKSRRQNKDEWELIDAYYHNIGMPPAIRTGGIVQGKLSPYWFKSFVSGVLPHWNRVVTLSSDLDGNYNSHMHMERYVFAPECEQCEGTGYVTQEITLPGGDCEKWDVKCTKCSGSGSMGKSPYGDWVIRRDSLAPDAPLPVPPAGFISKPTDIVGVIEQRIREEETRGLSAINFDILNKVGENQSGIAKTIDRQDMDSFLRRYSDHVFKNVIPALVWFTAWERYSTILFTEGDSPESMKRKISEMMPEIIEPKNFNVLSLEMLTEEYKNASQSNVSDSFLKNIERDIAVKQFVNDEEKKLRELVIIDLQPFPGKNPNDLLTLQNLGIEEWEIYKSIKLNELIDEAISDDKKFLTLKREEQKVIIDNKAKAARPPDEMLIPVEDDAEPDIPEDTEDNN